MQTPLLISFDSPTDFPGNGGWVNDVDADAITWTRFTATGAAGTTTCIKMNNFQSPVGAVDEYITPPFDISNMTGVTFRFQVAHAQRTASDDDLLRIFTSTNCGETWTPTSYYRSGAVLATAGIVPSNFTPTNASQWRSDSIRLNALVPRTNVRLKFQNISDRGNNTYLDEFEVMGNATNVDEVEDVTLGFGLFPNPSQGNATVQFQLKSPASIGLSVHDIAGRQVLRTEDRYLAPDNYELPLKVSTNGIYLVRLTVDGREHIRRLVVTE
ncbi:MAG: T9SS type A sorting domain-containing protein [Bacteroidota bacterium]